MAGRRVGLAAVAVAGLLAAGCGGSDESATVQWADGVCNAVSDWQSSITGTMNELTASNLTRDDFTSAWDDAKSATQQFSDDLQGLGKPDTQAGEEAEAAVTDLQASLSSNVDTIQTAVDGATNTAGVLTAVSVASATIVTMGNAVTSTVDELRKIGGAQSELQGAFQQSDSCKSLENK
jgi:hypothetical protein